MEKIAVIKFKQLLQRKKGEHNDDPLFWNGSKLLLNMDPMLNDKILLSKIVKSFQKYSRYGVILISVLYNFKLVYQARSLFFYTYFFCEPKRVKTEKSSRFSYCEFD